MCFSMRAWTNSWANSEFDGDMKRHDAHMTSLLCHLTGMGTKPQNIWHDKAWQTDTTTA